MNEYEHFLVVISSAVNHIKWFGLIESKLKYFIQSVEKEASIDSARIWPKPLTKRAEKNWTQLWFIGLTFHSSEVINISSHLNYFQDQLLYQAVDFVSDDMKIEAHIVRKSDLTRHITDKEFGEIVSGQSQKHNRVEGMAGHSYAGITKSNSYAMGQKMTAQLPSPNMPFVPQLSLPGHGHHGM